jgi:hypothetical protein
VYEALPALYLTSGVGATGGAIPMRSALMFASGALLLVAAAVIVEMRAAYRGAYLPNRR